ncbi:MAG: hypothetical protein HRF49_07555 [bacterium]|jgi:hypothetical protein
MRAKQVSAIAAKDGLSPLVDIEPFEREYDKAGAMGVMIESRTGGSPPALRMMPVFYVTGSDGRERLCYGKIGWGRKWGYIQLTDEQIENCEFIGCVWQSTPYGYDLKFITKRGWDVTVDDVDPREAK